MKKTTGNWVTPEPGVVSYQWSYSGRGVTIHNNGAASITVDFAANATSGDLSVQALSNTCISDIQTITVTFSVLPVVLSSFTGLKTDQGIQLKWTSVSEINVADFIVQRSDNGYDFNNIGTVIAKGSGNYSFKDISFIHTGFLYYQLKVVGTDGSKENSNVLAINMDSKSDDFLIYPNPARGTIMIISPYSFGRLAICNLMGETIISQNIIDKHTKVNIGNLLPGTYILNILSVEGKITNKLMVQ